MCLSASTHAIELTLTLLVLSRVQKCPEKMGGNLDGQIPDRDVGSGVKGAPDFGLPYYPPPLEFRPLRYNSPSQISVY